MKQLFKTCINYIRLYFKSLNLIFISSKLYTVLMLIFVPLRAIVPAVTITVANRLLNDLQESDFSNIAFLVTVWGIVFVASNLLAPLNTTIQGQLTDKVTFKLNTSLMEKSSELETIDYFENSKFYDDIQIISSQASWIPVNLLVYSTTVMGNVITLISMLLLLADFSIWISIAVMISLIPQGLIFFKIQKQAFETLVSSSQESRKINYYKNVVMSAEHIKDVRLYNLYNFFMEKYSAVFKGIIGKIEKNRLKQLVVSALFLLITGSISIGSFIYVIVGIENQIFPIGSILVFSSSIIYAIQNISTLVEFGSMLYDTLLYMDKYFKFMDIKVGHKVEEKAFPDNFNEIRFENITFAYPNSEKDVLKNLSFTVKKGEKIAVVGENGSGKSTLVKLFCRFYEPDRGHIFFDDEEYLNFDAESYHKNISAVFQDFSKFDLTLRENIAISNLDFINYDEKILKALRESGFTETDLEKILGRQFGGEDLSGGQWQKAAIARAFFKNSEVLILDEPTASIDPKTEYKIYSDFLRLTEKKTVFFITHRMAMVKKADKILLIQNGELMDFDSHENLMVKNSYYKSLYDMQASAYND